MLSVIKMQADVLRCMSVRGGAHAEALRCVLSATAAAHPDKWPMSDFRAAGRGLLTGRQGKLRRRSGRAHRAP